MLDLSDLAATQQLTYLQSPRKKTQLMIDQCKHALLARAFSHAARFIGIHRHRLLAQNCLAGVERSQSNLAMSYDRGDDADQIDIFARDDTAPVILDVWNIKFARDFCRMFAM